MMLALLVTEACSLVESAIKQRTCGRSRSGTVRTTMRIMQIILHTINYGQWQIAQGAQNLRRYKQRKESLSEACYSVLSHRTVTWYTARQRVQMKSESASSAAAATLMLTAPTAWYTGLSVCRLRVYMCCGFVLIFGITPCLMLMGVYTIDRLARRLLN